MISALSLTSIWLWAVQAADTAVNSVPIHQLTALVTPVAEDVSPWLPSLWNIAIWLGAGFFIDVVVLRILLRAAEKTPWQLDDAIIKCFFGKLFLLALFIGLDTGVSLLPVDPPFQMLASLKPITHKLMISLNILVVTWLIADVLISVIKHLSNRIEALPSTSIFHNIIRISVFCIGILVILQTLGISILPILTALGVGGLAISLALKDTLENIFAGFQIIFSKQIRIGDYVKLDSGIEGYAEDIGWRNSYIRQPAENVVIIPNAKLASSIVTNYSRPSNEMAITMECLVHYQSDLQLVETLAVESAKRVIQNESITDKARDPKFRFIAFTDLGVRFRLHIYVQHHRDEYVLISALMKEVHKTLKEANIGFSNMAPIPAASPQSVASSDDNASSAGSNNSENNKQQEEDSDETAVEAATAVTMGKNMAIKPSVGSDTKATRVKKPKS